MKFRSFVALEIPSHVQLEIASKIAKLVQRYPKPMIRWVEPGNIHLTLCFLGDRTIEELEFLAYSIYKYISNNQPFSMRITRAGTFPKYKNPRVVWVGIERPPGLKELQQISEELCIRNGYVNESKGFSPHLTLGRIRTKGIIPSTKDFLTDLSSISFESTNPINVEEIKIFKSELRSSGPIYNVLFNIPIGK